MKNYENTLKQVRLLSNKHTAKLKSPNEPIPPRPLTSAEKMGWKSNEYVRYLTKI